MREKTNRPVRTSKRNGTRYAVFSNGELWTLGEFGYMAGYVSDPDNIESAIDEAEEEMHELMQSARREFGS